MARWAAAAALVVVAVAGCGTGVTGFNAGSAAGGGDSAQGGAAQDGAGGKGSSATEPIPFGEAVTVRSGFDAEYEWEITLTGYDSTTYSEPEFSGKDTPCVAVLGTATLVKGPKQAEGLISAPGLFLVDGQGSTLDPGLCRPDIEDAGYTSALSIGASVGETVKFADLYSGKADDGVAYKVQDAISLADGGGADHVYLALR
jgi:hypothetical protein